MIGRTGYYRHLWEEIHIHEEDLLRLRNEILSSGRVGLATHKQHARGSAMPSDVRQDLEEARRFHDQPMPDTAGLQRLSEALAQLRENARSAIRSREARQMPADVMEERSRQAGEDVNRELLVGFARGRISAFLDTHFGVERLPYGPYWLLPDGGATLEAKRALLGTASSNRHHGLAGIVKVHVANFQDFANTYLTERGLAETEISDAIAPAVDFFVRLGWLPLDRAVEIIKKVEGDTAWHQVKTAIRLKELPARSFVEGVTRDFEPHWLDFLVWDVPPETSSVLWFDREKAWRNAGRPVDRAGIPLPDRAEKIMVSIRRCAEIWPAAVWPEVPGVAMAAPEAVAPNDDDLGPISTGMPGRPSKGKHLIEDEFDRRCGVGEVLSTVAEEAKALLSWYREAYRKEPPPTQKTTENNIRAAHRRWLASVRINGHG